MEQELLGLRSKMAEKQGAWQSEREEILRQKDQLNQQQQTQLSQLQQQLTQVPRA